MSQILENSSSVPHKPGRPWYLVALALCLLGPLIALYLIIGLFNVQKQVVRFSVPGVSNIVVQKAGTYTVWGAIPKTEQNQALLPDLFAKMDILFKHIPSGEVVDFIPKITWDKTENGFVHFSLGNVEFSHVGRYEITAQGPPLINFQLYLRKPSMAEIVKTLLLSALVTLLGIASGILFALIIFIKRYNAGAMKDDNAQKPELKQDPKTAYNRDETMWAMFCHLSGFVGFIFPFGNILAPLIIWAFKKNDSIFIDDQGKEAINFQISILIYYIIAVILILVVIGVFLLPIIAAFHIIAMIIAAVESASGKVFRYPFCIRFLKPPLGPRP